MIQRSSAQYASAARIGNRRNLVRLRSFSTDLARVVGTLMSASARGRRTGPARSVAFGRTPVIQTSKLGARIMRYELADHEWVAIKPMLPNKPRGVPRVNDRRVLNGIFWVLRSGAPWRDLPEAFGPYTTCYNRFVRWRRAGVWSRIIDALAAAHDAAVQMIDTSIVRVHQHGASITRNQRQSMGRSRGGLTSKIHAVVDSNGLPVRLALSPGENQRSTASAEPAGHTPSHRRSPRSTTTSAMPVLQKTNRQKEAV